MREFFARMYEWFGLFPFSGDLDEFLKGRDASCLSYLALPSYFYVGIAMLLLTTLIFMLQYDLIDVERFERLQHWELAAVTVFITNFLVAFSVPSIAILIHSYCVLLRLTFVDCLLFGLSNAVWALVYFALLSTARRWWLRNNRP